MIYSMGRRWESITSNINGFAITKAIVSLQLNETHQLLVYSFYCLSN